MTMSKFYWSLKGKGAFKKYQIMHVVTHLNHKRGKPFTGRLRTYPSNKWGYGYWCNKHRNK